MNHQYRGRCFVAERPVFVPRVHGDAFVETRLITFQWFAGLSRSQKQRSVQSLHTAAQEASLGPALEISSKSPSALGVELSAFRLRVLLGDGPPCTVEEAFQASKVFERGGPYSDLIGAGPAAAKRDPRLRESGRLVAFEADAHRFPTTPRTAFYDWLYCKALRERPALLPRLGPYTCFSDIEFNPSRSFNCQARSAALACAVIRRGFDLSVTADFQFVAAATASGITGGQAPLDL
jgi:hypothetical protein